MLADTDAPSGPVTLTKAPVEALVERTSHGLLPKVAEDGRKPRDIYARPNVMQSPLNEAGAQIVLIVGHLGLSEPVTSSAIDNLPGAVTLAFNPYARSLGNWVPRARSAGHEVLLQIPMEPFDYPDNDPGPHALRADAPPEENILRLKWAMGRFTGYAGVINYMGAKFSAKAEAFKPLEELQDRGLYYVDDGVSARSAAPGLARQLGLPAVQADLQLDRDPSRAAVVRALAQLEKQAQETGLAVGISGALPVPLKLISEWTKTLAAKNISLIPVSAAVLLTSTRS